MTESRRRNEWVKRHKLTREVLRSAEVLRLTILVGGRAEADPITVTAHGLANFEMTTGANEILLELNCSRVFEGPFRHGPAVATNAPRSDR